MKKIGFIGMGIMGLPMATNLLKKSGCDITGFDVFEAARERFAQAGGKTATDADEIYCNSDCDFSLPANNELVELLEAEGAEAVVPDLMDFLSLLLQEYRVPG